MQVEPDRWYYHADRLGMMVWQDMPSMCGMLNTSWGNNWYKECMNAQRSIPDTARCFSCNKLHVTTLMAF